MTTADIWTIAIAAFFLGWIIGFLVGIWINTR